MHHVGDERGTDLLQGNRLSTTDQKYVNRQIYTSVSQTCGNDSCVLKLFNHDIFRKNHSLN